MTIRTFAEKHRLKVSRDECGDEIIQGRRGHLYFDCGDLCLMVTDGAVARRSAWAGLGGLLWLGDITGGVQDVSIRGIPLESAKLAIRMCRISRRRVLSESHRKALAASNVASRFKSKADGSKKPLQKIPCVAKSNAEELDGVGK